MTYVHVLGAARRSWVHAFVVIDNGVCAIAETDTHQLEELELRTLTVCREAACTVPGCTEAERLAQIIAEGFGERWATP